MNGHTVQFIICADFCWFVEIRVKIANSWVWSTVIISQIAVISSSTIVISFLKFRIISIFNEVNNLKFKCKLPCCAFSILWWNGSVRQTVAKRKMFSRANDIWAAFIGVAGHCNDITEIKFMKFCLFWVLIHFLYPYIDTNLKSNKIEYFIVSQSSLFYSSIWLGKEGKITLNRSPQRLSLNITKRFDMLSRSFLHTICSILYAAYYDIQLWIDGQKWPDILYKYC